MWNNNTSCGCCNMQNSGCNNSWNSCGSQNNCNMGKKVICKCQEIKENNPGCNCGCGNR